MAHPELVEYIKHSLSAGQKIEAITQTLTDQDWSKEIVNEAILVATVPVPPTPNHPKEIVPMKQVASSVTVIPAHYTSPLSVMLAFLLFFALYALTNTFILDLNNVIAPYAAARLEETPRYQILVDQKQAPKLGSSTYTAMQQAYKLGHSADEAKSLFVAGIVSVTFWVIAFCIHLSFGSHKRQFLVLSMPYFVVAGFYMILLLLQVFSKLFEVDQTIAIYGTLTMVIVAITAAFIIYQRYNHKKPQPL